jgi:ectoine hydroxylase-related dioxygenase (phytanoyl-CoA dioxygenase family)
MSTAAPEFALPDIDGSAQERLSDEQARFFRDHGVIVIRGLLRGQELERLRRETLALIERARSGPEQPDTLYAEHQETGERVPCRIEFPVHHSPAARVLMGHPFVLRLVEQLQGPSFIPTWDALVFKNPGAGTGVSWHRDAAIDCLDTTDGEDWRHPVFNVDFYLDRADLASCVWAIPGSNRWSAERADAVCRELNGRPSFATGHGAVPLPVEAGDVIVHNIAALHASAPTRGPLRRVLYYEFRPCGLEQRRGPHVPAYIPLKQRVLEACLRERAAAPYTAGETAFRYAPEPAFAAPALGDGERLATFRYPHGEYWRR